VYFCLWPHALRHLPIERVTAAAAAADRPSGVANVPTLKLSLFSGNRTTHPSRCTDAAAIMTLFTDIYHLSYYILSAISSHGCLDLRKFRLLSSHNFCYWSADEDNRSANCCPRPLGCSCQVLSSTRFDHETQLTHSTEKCQSLHVAVNKCINWCFVHLFFNFALSVSLQPLVSPLTSLINCHWQTPEFV